MQLDLNALRKQLEKAPQEETVDSSDVNPYLLNEVLRPMMAGVDLRYGDIDFSQFDGDDLHTLAHYHGEVRQTSGALRSLSEKLSEAEASACKVRAFC